MGCEVPSKCVRAYHQGPSRLGQAISSWKGQCSLIEWNGVPSHFGRQGGKEGLGAWLDGLSEVFTSKPQQKLACCLGAFQSKIQSSRLLSQEILCITLSSGCDSKLWALISINPSLKTLEALQLLPVLGGSFRQHWFFANCKLDIHMGITGGSHFMKSPASPELTHKK